ncbi:MAG: serine protease [Alphaproteobacteria bacterium]|nr:serine protease [Alphaproteobacteria bacterium]
MRQIGNEDGIVRFISPTGDENAKDAGHATHVGMGMLLDKETILTCAHVINSAMGRPIWEDERPGGDFKIPVTFPILNDASVHYARIVDWSSPGRDGLDCAVLELETPAPSAVGVTILSVIDPDELADDDLSIYGSLAPGHPGAHVGAHLLGAVGAQWTQLDVKDGPGVQQGFSGGAVWDRQQRASIGMVVARQVGSRGITAYFLSAQRIAERFDSHFPVEVRKIPLRRQRSFSFVAIILFVLMLAHYLAVQGSATNMLIPWAAGSKGLAAFFGAHCFAIILGPYVMWHALRHARSFALRKWWQRVPVAFGGNTAGMLDNTRLGAAMVVLFLLLLPAYAQGAFVDKVFFERRLVFINIERFDSITRDDVIRCDKNDDKWCLHEDVGPWSFVPESPYFNHAYQIAGTCTFDDDCTMVTYFPGLQPAILFGSTLLSFAWFLLFIYALFRPWPYRVKHHGGGSEAG